MTKRKSADWHPEDIKAAVRKAGWTLKGLALANGLALNACQQACSFPRYLGELAIAEALGLPARQIWPSRFTAEGHRKHQRRTHRKASSSIGAGHRQNVEAA